MSAQGITAFNFQSNPPLQSMLVSEGLSPSSILDQTQLPSSQATSHGGGATPTVNSFSPPEYISSDTLPEPSVDSPQHNVRAKPKTPRIRQYGNQLQPPPPQFLAPPPVLVVDTEAGQLSPQMNIRPLEVQQKTVVQVKVAISVSKTQTATKERNETPNSLHTKKLTTIEEEDDMIVREAAKWMAKKNHTRRSNRNVMPWSKILLTTFLVICVAGAILSIIFAVRPKS